MEVAHHGRLVLPQGVVNTGAEGVIINITIEGEEGAGTEGDQVDTNSSSNILKQEEVELTSKIIYNFFWVAYRIFFPGGGIFRMSCFIHVHVYMCDVDCHALCVLVNNYLQ